MTLELIDLRLKALESYVDLHGYESYDPYDGLSSPFILKGLGNNQLGLRLCQQAVRLFPFNLRPALGIPPIVHTKTLSDFASAYAILAGNTHQTRYKEKTNRLLNLLEQLSLPVSCGRGWGLRFPFVTRFVSADARTPNIFQTVNAVHAFLDGYAVDANPLWLEIALQGFQFATDVIGYVETREHISWRYWQGLDTVIYNVSGLMLGLVSRLFSVTGDGAYADMARKLFAFLSSAQNPDGSWFYAADERGHWVDGFHTGYILEGTSRAILYSVLDVKNESLTLGTKYYLEKMFTPAGFPQYYPGLSYPVDIQNLAQAIQTLAFLNELEQAPSKLLHSVIRNADSALWNARGYYNFMKSRFFTYTTPMHRWGTAPMFLALVYAGRALRRETDGA